MEKTIQKLMRAVEVGGVTSIPELSNMLGMPYSDIESLAIDIWGQTQLKKVRERAVFHETNPLLFR